MDALPHTYDVSSYGYAQSEIECSADGKHPIICAPPRQFGGTGDSWSPEELLISAVASCFILTFRSIARGSSLEWETLSCDIRGILDRADGKTCFTKLNIIATLTLPGCSSTKLVERLLNKAEESCLITNSLSTSVKLETVIIETETGDKPPAMLVEGNTQ